MISWSVHGYSCLVKSITIESDHDRSITKVTGTHASGKTIDDILMFHSDGKPFNYFPQDIKLFFKNLNQISVQSSNIAIISKDDLKPFGSQLKNVYFQSNKIEAIEADMFELSPNLEIIYLTSNKIKYIGNGAFSSLNKLKLLSLSENPCYSGVSSDRSTIIRTIPQIESQCKDLQALERTQNLKFIQNPTTTEMPTTTTNGLIIEIDNLKTNNENLKAENEKFKKQISELLLEVEAEKQKNQKMVVKD